MKKKIFILLCLCITLVMAPKVQAFSHENTAEIKVNNAKLDQGGHVIKNSSLKVGSVLGQGGTRIYKTIINTSKSSVANTPKHYEEFNDFFQSWYVGDLTFVQERVTESGRYKTTFSGFLSYVPKSAGYTTPTNK